VTVAFGVINLVYIVLAVIGLWRGRQLSSIRMLVLFLVVRSVFLGTLENPEPRYTLECFPVVIVLAAIALALRARHYKNLNQTYRN
jgi:hypothetical protein